VSRFHVASRQSIPWETRDLCAGQELANQVLVEGRFPVPFEVPQVLHVASNEGGVRAFR